MQFRPGQPPVHRPGERPREQVEGQQRRGRVLELHAALLDEEDVVEADVGVLHPPLVGPQHRRPGIPAVDAVVEVDRVARCGHEEGRLASHPVPGEGEHAGDDQHGVDAQRHAEPDQGAAAVGAGHGRTPFGSSLRARRHGGHGTGLRAES